MKEGGYQMLNQKWTMPLSVEPCTWQKCQAGYQGRETNLETSCSLYYIKCKRVFCILYVFLFGIFNVLRPHMFCLRLENWSQ